MVGDPQKEVSPSPEVDKKIDSAPPTETNKENRSQAFLNQVEKEAEDGYLNVNRRHMKEFNKHKSSDAMKTLLKTEEQEKKKKQQAAKLASKVDFENKKNGVVAGPSILSKTSARKDDSGSRS